MKALISPTEKVLVPFVEDNILRFRVELGRVCQKELQEFPVAEPLFWVECDVDLDVQSCYYDSISNTIVTFVYPENNLIPG